MPRVYERKIVLTEEEIENEIDVKKATKKCYKCLVVKIILEFPTRNDGKVRKRRNECYVCVNTRQHVIQRNYLKRKKGVTDDDDDEIFKIVEQKIEEESKTTDVKECNVCYIIQPIQYFGTYIKDDGIMFTRLYCNSCCNLRSFTNRCDADKILLRKEEVRINLENGLLVCNICNVLQELQYFPFENKGKDNERRYLHCVACERIKKIDYFNTPHGFKLTLLGSMKQRSQENRMNGRVLKHDFNYDMEILNRTLVKCEDKCMISGLPLAFRATTDWKASPERLDNDDDYTEENVAIICGEFNTGYAQWTPNDVDYMYNLSKIQITNQEWDTILVSLVKPEPQNGKRRKIESGISDDGASQYACQYYCGMKFVHEDDMYNTIMCMECSHLYQKRTIYHELTRLLCATKNTNDQRNSLIKDESKYLEHTIGLEFLIKLYIAQKGRCYYSNIPFQHECLLEEGKNYNKLRQMSVERINTKIGYTPENSRLIVLGFQSIDCTRTVTIFNGGSCGWSRAKFAYLCLWLEERKTGLKEPSIPWLKFKEEFKDSNVLVIE